jgi:hypothetical protein
MDKYPCNETESDKQSLTSSKGRRLGEADAPQSQSPFSSVAASRPQCHNFSLREAWNLSSKKSRLTV